MAQIKFFRGSQETSLPNQINDGAIYFITDGQENGDLYADINGSRVKIGSSTEKEEISISSTEPVDDNVKI